ncbi:Armadillo-like helical [Penicillium taxi]|uniref:Armadillo-like helical n=1 Tax=Penicillium taxi TaxID=168475 RepID=UPI002545154F|nr:Armadillo-like helical [Penicillium taxi]KAJ5908778.1 Armadillo-like helical [Penicillium taxi]
MEADSTYGAQSIGIPSMEEIALNIQILPEKTLQEIAKGPLVKFTLTCTDNEKVSRVWESLSKTLSSPSFSHQHTYAACNAVSAFIDAAVNSKNEQTRQIVLSSETWLAIFNVFLTRYEDVTPKPLKQLLASLTNIMLKHYRGETRASVQRAIANAILPSFILGELRSRLKGSLVCLEMFIRKKAMTASELILIVQKWLLDHQNKWVPVYEKDREALYYGQHNPESANMTGEPSYELAARVLFLGLLTHTNDRGMAGTSGTTLASILQKMKLETPDQNVSLIWVSPVRHMMLQNMDYLEILSNQILQPIFIADPAGFNCFVERLPLKSLLAGDMIDTAHSEYLLLFTSLQMGKNANLVHDDYDSSKSGLAKGSASCHIILKSEIIGKFLLHRESTIRVAALALLITAFSRAKPFTKAATRAILNGLPSMHADSDSYSRGEIMSLTRKFIIRLKGGILGEGPVLESAADKKQPASTMNDSETKFFLREYLDFLESDLSITASYPRHISALKAIKLLLDSGLDPRAGIIPPKSEVQTRWQLQMDVFEPRLLRLLVDLLLDPFDEVRQASLTIINLFPQQIMMRGLRDGTDQHPTPGLRLTDALARAESIASKTSRADHADTVARLYHVLFTAALSSDSPEAGSGWWETKASVVNAILEKLEERLLSPKGLFNSSMQEAPLHGHMSGLRQIVLMPSFHSYLTQEGSIAWRSVHDRIVAICDKVWQQVKPFLCDDSPEGNSDDLNEELSVGPKDILSYSWRSLRESSLLLHATMFNQQYAPAGKIGLQLSDFEHVGRTSFTQLAELRHRGAFSTVSQTFATCCTRCSTFNDPAVQELPRFWYQEAKNTIFESAAKLTRRSAGLPALMTGILSSSPGSPFFNQALNELHDISRLPVEYDKDQQYLELPQVHAMNCLKDIFTNTKLGQFTESFIMPALILSAERLGSPIWTLRNSGLMLFRALLIRMCRLVPGNGTGFGGESGSEPGSKISFPKYTGLIELLSQLLASSEGAAAHEGTEIMTERIFPALELIGEKIPSFSDNYDTILCALVLEHLKSPVWGIREHAARVYASLLTRTNILGDVRHLVDKFKVECTENYAHGTVFCVQYSLRRFAATTNVFWASHVDDLMATIRYVLGVVFPVAKSPYVATDLVEILNDMLERSINAGIEDKAAIFVESMVQEYDLNGVLNYLFDASKAGWNLTSTTRASSLLRRAVAWCTLLRMLSLSQWSGIPEFYHGVALLDVNVATWISEQVHEKFGTNEKYRKPLVDLYSSILLNKYPEDVKTMAASNLTSVLEDLLSSETSAVSQLALPWEHLGKSFQPELHFEQWNRQATDAELRLQGCLLATRVSSIEGQSLESLKVDLYSWAIKLRSALTEETEFTTRYAAVTSLHSFQRGLRPEGASPKVDPILLDIYLIMYDMLNDDDEDLRDIAADTASWVLSYSSVSPTTAIALGPLNASLQLSRFIIDHYSDSLHLSRRLIKYLTGQEPRISGSDKQTHLISVADLIAEYDQDSTVLFVEEKQNLFIDDVREVDVWYQALLRMKRSAYPETLLRQISSWVSEGLSHISNSVAQRDGGDGLIGWTSKPETFILGIRIFSIASALVSEDFPAPNIMDVEQSTLQSQLQSLSQVGKSVSLHDEWLRRIELGLNCGVRS